MIDLLTTERVGARTNSFGARTIGLAASENLFRYSAKYTDTETGLLYYGYRYYQPMTGRWLSRDPIEESGGIKLYVLLENSPLNRIDALGLWSLFFDNSWTASEVNDIFKIFEELKVELPMMQKRCLEWMAAAAKLPKECAYKQRLQQELTNLSAVLKGITSDLNSSQSLYFKQMDLRGDYAQAMFNVWPYRFTGEIRLDNSDRHNWRRNLTSAKSSIFHELSHVAGVPDEKHLPTGWWTDNAHDVESLESNPGGFSLYVLVTFISDPFSKKDGGPGLGTNCCPSKISDWAP